MFPPIKKLVRCDDWIFVQDSVPSHRSNLVQDLLEKTFCLFLLGFCKDEGVSRQSWTAIQFRRRILKMKIKAAWKDCSTDLKPLRKAIKQFVPSLRAVEEKQGHRIKMIFG